MCDDYGYDDGYVDLDDYEGPTGGPDWYDEDMPYEDYVDTCDDY